MIRVRAKIVTREVERLLTKHRVVTAPVPIEFIADREGLRVYHDGDLEDDYSGFLYREDPSRPLIVINKNHSDQRRRFTLAHEMGHYFVHAGQSYVSKERYDRHILSSRGTDVEEIEANRFAAELLMPAPLVEAGLVGLSPFLTDEMVIGEMSHKFGVSSEAMKYRLVALGFVAPDDLKSSK